MCLYMGRASRLPKLTSPQAAAAHAAVPPGVNFTGLVFLLGGFRFRVEGLGFRV